MNDLSHADLVNIAARWLSGTMSCGAVLTEIAGSMEIPDAIGFHGTRSFLVECKTSRSDFLADHQKTFRKKPEMGMGLLRFYLTPKGLLKPEEVGNWGLIETSGKKVFVRKQSQSFLRRNTRAEMGILYTGLSRVQFRLDRPLHKVVKWGYFGTMTPLSLPHEVFAEERFDGI